jgi:prepilin-type processing-associated H-X9-DG protein
MKNWVWGTMYKIQDAINDKILVDPRVTCLATYNPNARIYKCPADITQLQGRDRVRTISMNSAVGTIWYSSAGYPGASGDGRPGGSPIGGGWLTGPNYASPDANYRTYGKTSSFTVPGPASTWVIADENAWTINDGSLAVSMGTIIVDFPGNYHGGGCGLAFADGHAEIHKWMDAFLSLIPQPNMTVPQAESGKDISTLHLTTSQDLDWIRPYTTALK